MTLCAFLLLLIYSHMIGETNLAIMLDRVAVPLVILFFVALIGDVQRMGGAR